MRARQKSKVLPAEPPAPVEVIPEGRQEKIHYYLQKVEDHVVGLIDADSVKIPKQKIPFAHPKKDDAETLADRLRRMQASREAMQSKLQSIAEEEQDLKLKHRQLEKLEAKGTAREGTGKEGMRELGARPRSELSAQDISLLRRLKKEHRQFERSLDEKTQAHLKAMESIRKQQAELQQRKKKEQGQAKRKEISKRLEALNKQRSERQQQYQEQKRKLVQLKAKKKLFQEAQRAQREKEKEELEKKVALMQSRLKEKQMDLQSIRSHEDKYREIREQQRAQRQRKKEEFEQAAKQRREQASFQKSKYYTIAHQETKRKKQEELEKQREKIDLIEAAKAYAEEVRRQRSPRVKTKSSQQHSEEKVEGLSFQEVKNLGNNYMQHMRKVIKKRKGNTDSILSKEDKSKISSKDTTLPLKIDHPSSTNTSKYRDYLSERRMLKPREEMSQTEERIRDRLIRRDLADVYRIMNSKDQRGDKLDRVKTIAEKLDIREKGDDHHIIDKISAKLKILETLADSH